MPASLLLLADGRLPTGGHAHSAGMEEAVAAGRVRDAGDLARWLEGRLHTAGRVDAGIAAWAWDAACASGLERREELPAALARVDAEGAARMPSPALRRASRAQGRGLVRTARRCWPAAAPLDLLGAVHPEGPLHAVAIGVSAAVGGLDRDGAAGAAVWSAVSSPAWAAVRLLGFDPLEVAAVLAALAADVDAVVAASSSEAVASTGAPVSEIGAEHHAAWEVRLFAS